MEATTLVAVTTVELGFKNFFCQSHFANTNLKLTHLQLPAVAYIRLPFYEAKVLFSEGRGRM